MTVRSGELLLDEHRFADAAEMFDKSFKLEKDKWVF